MFLTELFNNYYNNKYKYCIVKYHLYEFEEKLVERMYIKISNSEIMNTSTLKV